MTHFYFGFITGVILGPCVLVVCLCFYANVTRWKR